MTEITLENIGNRYIIQADGHSNYSEHGADIVCAGVSTLVQTFAYLSGELEDRGRVSILDFQMRDGFMAVVVEGDIQQGYEMAKIGLKAIADAYPDYVVVRGEN